MEPNSLILNIIGLGFLMLFSAFFSGTETALSALTRTQIQRLRLEKNRGSRAVVRFLDNPRRLFITVLFGNTLVNMAFVSIMGVLVYEEIFKGRNPGTAYLTVIVVETTILLLLGEITPKTAAIRNAEKLSRFSAPLLWAFSRFIYPFRRFLRLLTDLLLPIFGVKNVVDTSPVTSEEIRATVKATAEGGAIDEKEGELLSNIFELQDTRVKEIMVPRTKMVCVEVSVSVEEAFQKAMQKGLSRLPVYRKRLDNICGIFYVKDLPRWKNVGVEKLGVKNFMDLTLDDILVHQEMLNSMNPGHENTLIRPPFFVFKTRDIGSLLKEMTQKKLQMAVLLDEFGGVVGLATAEDIIEEVVGEIVDEYDAAPAQKLIREADVPHSFLVPGPLSLRTLNRKIRLKLDTGTADTVSGYVISLAGYIPASGEVIRDLPHHLEFEVLKMAGTRIELVRLRLRRTKSRKLPPVSLLFAVLFSIFAMSAPSTLPGGGATVNPATILVFAFLLLFSLAMMGFFAGTETAVVSASQTRMEILAQQNDRRARFIRKLMQEPDRMLGTVLGGTNLMAVAAGAAGLRLTQYILPGNESLWELVNTIVLTFIILLFCEILPKTVFRAKADSLALWSAPVLRFSDAVLRPFVILITKLSNRMVRFAENEDQEERARIMREELKLLAEMGKQDGDLKKDQFRMVQGILALENLSVGKVMTPLVDMIAVPKNLDPVDFLKIVADTGYSRIPVYQDRIDHVIGIVNSLDVLYAESLPPSIEQFIRKNIRHEPESRRIFPLLRELTASRNLMVFVVDEYGGVVGLVTIEDLVEEVVGDIWDEKDREERDRIHSHSDRVLDCDGKTEIQVLNHDYELSIPEGDYNTIAGFVIEKFQRIPKKGESLKIEALKFLVLDSDAKSVKRIRILKLSS